MKMTDNRFKIGCSICGVGGHEKTLREALNTANRIHIVCDDVWVEDLKAQVGEPLLYSPDGEVREYKPSKN